MIKKFKAFILDTFPVEVLVIIGITLALLFLDHYLQSQEGPSYNLDNCAPNKHSESDPIIWPFFM